MDDSDVNVGGDRDGNVGVNGDDNENFDIPFMADPYEPNIGHAWFDAVDSDDNCFFRMFMYEM